MNYYLVLILIGLFVFGFNPAGHAQDTLWTRFYGDSNHDWVCNVEQTYDGGYVFACNGFADLVKINVLGDVQWTRDYGISPGCVRQTRDGGYIIVSQDSTNLIKTDQSGNPLWTRAFNMLVNSIQQTTDGSYILCGSLGLAGYAHNCLFKITSSGDSIWQQYYIVGEVSMLTQVEQTADGGFIGTGPAHFQTGCWDYCLLKTDSDGNMMWVRTYGREATPDESWALTQAHDGGYILTGLYFWTLKTDSMGDSLWSRYYGAGEIGCAYSIRATNDGGFIIAGNVNPFGPDEGDAYVVKINSSGFPTWDRYYQAGGNSLDQGWNIIQANDGNYMLAGRSNVHGQNNFDIWLLKIANGYPQPDINIYVDPGPAPVVVPAGGSFTYSGILINNTDQAVETDVAVFVDVPGIGRYGPLYQYHDISLSPHDTLVVPGIVQEIPVYALSGEYDYVAICGGYPANPIDSNKITFTVIAPLNGGAKDWNLYGWFENSSVGIPSAPVVLGNYPNPFNASTIIDLYIPRQSTITLDVYNILGRKVASIAKGTYQVGQHQIFWDASDFPSGVYFYRLTTPTLSKTKRMLLLK